MVRAHTVNTIQSDPEAYTWKPARLLNQFRLFVIAALLVAYLSGAHSVLLSQVHNHGFVAILLAYLLVTLGFVLAAKRRYSDFESLLYTQTYLDIVAIVLLMHSAGGISSGLGMLLIMSISGAGLLYAWQYSLLFAALASLALLSDQMYLALTNGGNANFTQAGLLGAALFGTAILSSTLTRKGRASEDLARQQAVDLENLAQLNDNIIQNMDAGIVAVDANGAVRLANESARLWLGLAKHPTGQLLATVAPKLAAQYQRWLSDPSSTSEPLQEAAAGFEVQPLFTPLTDQGTLIYLDDLGFLREQLQQLKLASLGRLTASIAHEIRNPLGAISHAAQLLQESASLAADDYRLTTIIHQHCQRMNRIIQDVLQLSRRNGAQRECLALGRFLRNFQQEFCLGKDISQMKLKLEVDIEGVEVLVDATQLYQVLWNLCGNAVTHASPPVKPTEITLSAGVAPDTKRPFIEVHDNGLGVPDDQVNDIFEPFFTSSHSGTGLGLFIARELCAFNQASLNYQRSPQGGACFRISFSQEIKQAA